MEIYDNIVTSKIFSVWIHKEGAVDRVGQRWAAEMKLREAVASEPNNVLVDCFAAERNYKTMLACCY